MNMQRRINLTIIWSALLVFVMGMGTPLVSAATPTTTGTNTANNGQALEIAPPVLYLTVNPGQTVNTQIFIRDVSSGPLLVKGQANDFVASGQDGTPKILLDNSTNVNDPYSLKGWVSPPSSLLLVPKQIKSMNITIQVPANASPGGHYGVIRFTATAPSVSGSGVSLAASLGSLLLLTVTGNIQENLQVQQFSVNHSGSTGKVFESGPLNFVEVLKNTGNVHVQPAGQVIITDTFGKKIGALNVNVPPGNVLPQSSRKFTQSLDKTVIGNRLLFGRYKANLHIVYGSSKKVLTASLTFWIIPFKLIGGIIIVLVGAFFILRYAIRRYNRYVLEQSQKNRRQ